MSVWHYIIGDIHGCLAELQELEKKIMDHAHKNQTHPLIISVGDLIDRGPQSAKVVNHFMKGAAAKTHLAIMGNHEMLFLEMLQHFAAHHFTHYPQWWPTYRQSFDSKKGMAPYLTWKDFQIFRKCFFVGQGGYQTLQSFDANPHQPRTWNIPESTIDYLVSLPFYFKTDHFFVTHALITSTDWQVFKEQFPCHGHRIQHWTPQRHQQFQQASHSILWNRTPPPCSPDSHRLHISGHTPVPRVKRFSHKRCLQIDTGCVFGGRLTAYCVEKNILLSVPAQRQYAEPYK